MKSATRRAFWRSVFRDGRRYVPCSYCGTTLLREDATIDHVIPRSAGGTSAIQNLAVACKPCNEAKADMSLVEFMLTVRMRESLGGGSSE